jgi:uncharacterized repeat protein (TIGR03833 family)
VVSHVGHAALMGLAAKGKKLSWGLRIHSSVFGVCMSASKSGQHRKDILPGITVDVVLKKDQRTGKRTRGVVKQLLTNSSFHPHGIKVRLEDGQVGRVAEIID